MLSGFNPLTESSVWICALAKLVVLLQHLRLGLRENPIYVMKFGSLVWLTRMARKNKATHDDSEKSRAKLLLGPVRL